LLSIISNRSPYTPPALHATNLANWLLLPFQTQNTSDFRAIFAIPNRHLAQVTANSVPRNSPMG
jgi:hypothetical protein